MKVKNVSSIFFAKFNLVYKMILFLLIISILVSIVGVGAILPVLSGLRKDIKALSIGDTLGEYVKSLLSGKDSEVAFNNLVNVVHKIPEVVRQWNVNVSISVAVFVIAVFVFALLYFMAYYTISDILHQFMSSNSKFGFASNYVYNAKKSLLFALIYAPIAIVYYILMGGIVVGLSYLVSKITPVLGIIVGYFLFILGLSVRRTIFAFWIPAMVKDGLSIKEALKQNFTLLKQRFDTILGEYFMICIAGVMLTVLCAVATVGVGVIVVYCIVWLIMEISDLVEYYEVKGYKFYIDDQTVIDPKKKFKDAVLEDNIL